MKENVNIPKIKLVNYFCKVCKKSIYITQKQIDRKRNFCFDCYEKDLLNHFNGKVGKQ